MAVSSSTCVLNFCTSAVSPEESAAWSLAWFKLLLEVDADGAVLRAEAMPILLPEGLCKDNGRDLSRASGGCCSP